MWEGEVCVNLKLLEEVTDEIMPVAVPLAFFIRDRESVDGR